MSARMRPSEVIQVRRIFSPAVQCVPTARKSLWGPVPAPAPCGILGGGRRLGQLIPQVDTHMSPRIRLTLDGNCRPIILDPADPTGNLGHNARWDLLAQEAAACMSALCCIKKDGSRVQPWPVKVRALRCRGSSLRGQGRGRLVPKGQGAVRARMCPCATLSCLSPWSWLLQKG